MKKALTGSAQMVYNIPKFVALSEGRATMKPTLSELIRPYRSVSIIGMCKNAGKTTVLNQIIREATGSGRVLALTSIGRDGEDKDLVTGTQKPGIHVAQGTLIATASELILRHCDVTREILDTTGISTPMGDVILLRARSDGSIQLAGPSMTGQLARLREDLFRFGADMVLIDGALSRKTLCSRQVTEATILCTGASYHKSMDTVVEDTAYQCEILTLPETEDPELRCLTEFPDDFRGTVILGEEGPWTVPAGLSVEDALRQREATGARAIFFGGALSDFLMRPLLMSSAPLKGLTFAVRDSSKLLLKRESFQKLLRRGVRLQVLHSVNLVALTVNPFSAYGFHFPKDALLARMESRTSLPVIDVMSSR